LADEGDNKQPKDAAKPAASSTQGSAGGKPAAAENVIVVPVDQTKVQGAKAADVVMADGGDLPSPDLKKFNLEEAQERTRGQIAGALVALLFVIVIFAFMTVWAKFAMDDLKVVLELIVGPVIALVGTATGFYFGGKK